MDLRVFRASAQTAAAYLAATGLAGERLEAHRRDLARFLVDAAPVHATDDAGRAALVDGLLATVRSGTADRNELRSTLERLFERWRAEVRDAISDLADDIASQSIRR